MSVRKVVVHAVLIVLALAMGAFAALYLRRYETLPDGSVSTLQQRQALFELLKPVALGNCQLARFGEHRDGGYLMCENLLGGVEVAYSYGISGYDKWGCDMATKRGVTLHQYDCFDLTQPSCQGGRTVFHAECVAERPGTDDGRRFDTVVSQVARNGDTSKRLALKMDVEGAEWQSLLAVPDDLLERIDQMAIEFHGVEDTTSVALVRRLKQFFEVAHLHVNNASCTGGMEPFTGWAYEVLFVNKRLAVVDPARTVSSPHPLDSPNLPLVPDCQP